MYYTIEDAAKVLAKALGKDELSVSDLVIYAVYGHSDEATAFHPTQWTQAGVRAALEEALLKRADTDDIRQNFVSAMERVPDDTTCAMMGWFFSGYALSEMINGGALANNEPELHANLLSALRPEKLSMTALSMLHDDMHRFHLVDATPMNLITAMIACQTMRENAVSLEAEEAEQDVESELEKLESLRRRSTARRRQNTRH